MRQHVERLYIDFTSSLTERLEFVRYNQRSEVPYPAEFMRVGPNNIQFQGRIICGHNPWLYARLVTDLRVTTTDRGEETLLWSELPLPNFPI